MTTTSSFGKPSEAQAQAMMLVSETMGELVEFWGFKASMGRIWACLYLSTTPLTAQQLADLTSLSAGAVSMGMHELGQWGLISRVPVPGERKRYYTAHTDIWEIIRRIIRERELRLIERSSKRFERAVDILQAATEAHPDNASLRIVLNRAQGLLTLSKTGYKLVERFADIGDFSLGPIRGTLKSTLVKTAQND